MSLLRDDSEIRTAVADLPPMATLDRAHLARFTLGDQALEREILGLFEADTPRRLEALRKAQTDQEWKIAAHTLKGSGRAVGAWRLANAAAAAEAVGGVEDRAACLRAIHLVEMAADEVCAAIRASYAPL